jgi:hypothetical protein
VADKAEAIKETEAQISTIKDEVGHKEAEKVSYRQRFT